MSNMEKAMAVGLFVALGIDPQKEDDQLIAEIYQLGVNLAHILDDAGYILIREALNEPDFKA